jgi:hypothetical protein
VLLLLDNHDSHISIATIEFAKSHGIVMLTFPSHCSHKLQPLDRSVYGPLKRYYNSACDDWLLNNPGKPMTIHDIAECVGHAFPLAFTTAYIQAGFRVSGTWPFNRNIFNDDEFMSSYVTDRPDPQQQSLPVVEPIDLNESSARPAADQLSVNTVKTPEQVKPFPKAGARKTKRGRKQGKTQILTDTPVENVIAEQNAVRGTKRKAVDNLAGNKQVAEESEIVANGKQRAQRKRFKSINRNHEDRGMKTDRTKTKKQTKAKTSLTAVLLGQITNFCCFMRVTLSPLTTLLLN